MSASPEDFAQALLEFLDLEQPFEFDQMVLSEIGLQLREVPARGFDGALLRLPGKARGIIAVRGTIPEPGSRRFTIAHEIGHYVLPGHDTDRSVCTENDLGFSRARIAKAEQEANQFAAELLLPSKELKKILKERGTSMDTCKFISKRFGTSLTAAAVRCIELTDSKAAFVESSNGAFYRFQPSRSWEVSKYYIPSFEELPSKSLAKQLSGKEKEKQGRVPAAAWVKTRGSWELYEHSILMSRYNAIITMLTEV